MKRTSRIFGNLLLCAITVLVTLLIAEVLWQKIVDSGDVRRQFNEKLRFVNPPNSEWVIKKKEFTTHMRTNSIGFRGPDMPEGPKENEIRILFLGDSFVEAKQVEENERFVELTEAALAEKLQRPVVARTMAIGGSTPALQLLYYREIGRDFNPDIVVQVVFPENDLMPQEGPYRFRDDGNDLILEDIWIEPEPPCSWKCELLKKSSIIRNIYQALRKKREATPEKELGDYYWYTEEGQRDLVEQGKWKVLSALVGTLRDEVEGDGGKFIVALMPSAIEMQPAWQEEYLDGQSHPRDSWKIDNLLTTSREVLEEDGISTFDLRFAFLVLSTSSDDVPLYVKSDPHLSLNGHRAISNALFGVLLRMLRE